jgi:Fur family ferric uptake transcriptional regulator
MSDKITGLLQQHDLRKTAIRVQVLELFLHANQAIGQQEVELQMSKADRITVYRTLRTFEQRGIIHQAIDGTGKMKYALCEADCNEDAHYDSHAHFHCEICNKTVCLDQIPVPNIHAPKGYQVHQAHLLLSGKCETCQ